jgi:hypothetical protein
VDVGGRPHSSILGLAKSTAIGKDGILFLVVFRAQNVIKRIGGSKLLRPRGSGKWRRKNRPIGKRTTMMAAKRPNTEGVEKGEAMLKLKGKCFWGKVLAKMREKPSLEGEIE